MENGNRYAKFLLLAALLLAAGIYCSSLTPYIGDGYDDSVYVGLAKGIAERHAYVQTALPDMPPASKYPPGWPMFLSVVWLVWHHFPANAMAFKAVSVFFTLLLSGLVFFWLHWRGESQVYALLIALLTLFHPYVLQFGTSAFSEISFSAILVFSVWALERYAKLPEAHWRDALLPSLAAALSMYLRMAGLVIIAASALYFLSRKGKRLAAMYFIVFVSLWVAPYLFYLAHIPMSAHDYGHEIFLKSIEQPALGTIGLADLLFRIVGNLRAILLAGLPGMILPSQIPLTYVNMPTALRVGAPIAGVDYALATLLGTAILVPMLLRRSLLDYILAAYLSLLLIWPWEPTRLLVPFIPFLYLYFFDFLGRIGAAISHKSQRAGEFFRFLGWGVALIFILLNIGHQIDFAFTTRKAQTPPMWQARYRLFEWLDENTPQDAVFASLSDYQLYLYTGHRCVRTFNNIETVREYGVDYIVLIPYGGVMLDADLSRLEFEPLYEAHPSLLRRVYVDADAGIEVYAVLP